MNFGDRLRALIDERDITQKEVASQLNIAPSTMGSYVQNTREPDFETLKQLAKYFAVSTDYLLGCYSGKAGSNQEDDLLRIFRSLSEEQREICIEQCKVFVRLNHQKRASSL
jgi:Predicted transcriptional regulators